MGSKASDVASKIYSEKVFIKAKAFVVNALSNPPTALQDIIAWLYYAASGPQLLHRIIHDCRTFSGGQNKACPDKDKENHASRDQERGCFANVSWIELTGRLSAGAQIPLQRHIKMLVDFEDHVEREKHSISPNAQSGND